MQQTEADQVRVFLFLFCFLSLLVQKEVMHFMTTGWQDGHIIEVMSQHMAVSVDAFVSFKVRNSM